MGTRGSGAAGPKWEFARFAALYIFVFMAISSLARTRLLWYSAPVYPLAALLVALGLEQLTRQARRRWHWPKPLVASLLVLAFLLPGGLLLAHEWNRFTTERTDAGLLYGYQLPELLARRPGLQSFIILRENHDNAQLDFYVAALRQQGVRAQVVTVTDSVLPALLPHQQVLVCAGPLQQRVRQRYATRPLTALRPCEFIEILARR